VIWIPVQKRRFAGGKNSFPFLIAIIMISLAKYRDYPVLIELWEQSVRATHHFLSEDYLQEIKTLLPGIFPLVKIFVWRENDGNIRGFAGVARGKMEMLFIHPNDFGQGLGSQLTNFCIYALKIDKVDVNEHNVDALKFYQKMGYKLIGREEVDSLGRPYPILHLQHFPQHSHEMHDTRTEHHSLHF
jgi:putative acetyltransferase